MNKVTTLAFGLTFAAAASVANAGEWESLFNGKDINGFVQHNGWATYRVAKGAIVGKTAAGSPNSFLCTKKEYGDFELEFEVKVDDGLNSGVQIRSAQKPAADGKGKNNAAGRVYGPQIEIEATGDGNGREGGYIYGEATGLGWLVPKEDLKPHKHMKDNEWNKYRVVARGPRIQTWINGNPIYDLTHEEIYKTHPKGFIGLQVHGIGKKAGPYSVSWRNLRIREF